MIVLGAYGLFLLFSLVVENLWQIPTSRELSESSHISEKILAAVTRRVPGV